MSETLSWRVALNQSKHYMASIFIIFALSSCCTPYTQTFCCAPDECEQAKSGFKEYAPIIAALETYNKENNRYPVVLKQLVPKYLKSITDNPTEKLSYISTEITFELTFKYYGPGANKCTYSSVNREWECMGYF